MAGNYSRRLISESYKQYTALLLIYAMTFYGFPPPVFANPSSLVHSRKQNALQRNIAEAWASTQVSMASLRARLDEAADELKSFAHPPSELQRLSSQFEEPLVATATTSTSEDNALLAALKQFRDRTKEDDFSALLVFLAKHPNSAWRVALLTNLGLLNYHYGYFSKALSNWSEAWTFGKSYTNPKPHALVDRAVAELARMHARLGHADALEALFKDMGTRKVTGSATEILTGAHDGLWMMRHDPGVSYLCGPMALKNLLLAEGFTHEAVGSIDDYRSGPHGVTFEQVAALATKAGLRSQLVYRSPGEPVPMPSIVHWKVNHFAALLGYANGRYHVQDPTFGTDLWITADALNAESSGYFLVSQRDKAEAWEPVRANVAQTIVGMGFTNAQKPGTSNCNPQESTLCSKKQCSGGLCDYAISELTVSLNLTDTPVGYTPPKGPSVKISLSYNQREDSQPAVFGWYNISPKWTLNFLTYIVDDPRSPGANVSRYQSGGGSFMYYGYNATTHSFVSETGNGAMLTQTSSLPVVYTRSFAGGHKAIYSESNGATTYPRLVFLSKIVDPAGNALTLNYDSQLRLMSITDATGRKTTFRYEATASLLVTTITDPFGRSAHLTYDSYNRLSQITDVLGLKSQFTYDSSSLINAMTTPYGTTTFSYSDSTANPTGDVTRYLNVTDPLGNTERMEYRVGAPNIPYADPANTVPAGMNTYDAYLYYRDTFYWDKHAYAVANGNYTMARQTHWAHWSVNANYTSDFIESSKDPLENRVWFNYPGQAASYLSGTYDKPTAIGRRLDDGSTQFSDMTYNSSGLPLTKTDEMGRLTKFTYADNNIDLLTIQQLLTPPSTYQTLATFGSFNASHEPQTYIGVDGKEWKYSYNVAGQLLMTTDPNGGVTSYQYDPLGRLSTMENANSKNVLTLTYDEADRVETRMDFEGYKLTYEYDNLDRVTAIIYPDGSTDAYDYTFQTGSNTGKPSLDLRRYTDRLGRVTTYDYDADRRLISVTQPEANGAHITSYSYYEDGTLKEITDPNGNVTHWNIDLQSRPTSKTYAFGTSKARTENYAYEATNSRLHSITDAKDQVKTFTYAHDNRITKIAYPKSVNPTPDVSFVWGNRYPHLISMTDGTGTTHYAYYSPGSTGGLKRAWTSGPFVANSTIFFSYDALGRLSGRKIPGGDETFGYDAISRLISHGTPLGTFAYTYLGQTEQVTSRKVTNGKVTVGTDWTYDTNDNDRRLINIANSGVSRSYALNYTIPGGGGTNNPYDILNIQDNAAVGHPFASQDHVYGYDAIDRLTSATSEVPGESAYTYDQVDNITNLTSAAETTNATYDSLNEMNNWGAKNYVYDSNGNTLSGDDVHTYKWDAENRLIEIDYVGSNQKSQFSYDGTNRRVIDTETAANGTVTATRLMWCGNSICQTRDGSDTVLRRDLAEGEYVVSNGQKLVYEPDHLGSVRDVMDATTGARQESYDFDSYGAIARQNGSAAMEYRFAGLSYHPASGLNLATNRVQDGITGRWLSRDPLRENAGVNLYAYVAADPINQVDPFGLCGSKQSSFCEKLDKAVADTKNNLYDWQTQTWRWNDPDALNVDLISAKLDLEEDTYIAHLEGLGGVGLGASALQWKALAARSIQITGVLLGIFGELTALDASRRQGEIDALGARLNQLNAEAARLCPLSH